jgi:hypothetical protein
VKAPSGGVLAPRTGSIVAAVTGGPSPREHLIWWFGGTACAARAGRVGSKFTRGAQSL